MRNGFPTWLLLLTTLALAGCRRNELVENQLRARDVEYREALEELMRNESMNADLRRENEALRASQNLSPDVAALTFPVRKITIGRGTSGFDNDRVPGDEGINVWIEPRDAGDRVVKAPGNLQLAILEIAPTGEKYILGTWDICSEKLQPMWKQGLLSVGYMAPLTWTTPPRFENIRVVARFCLPDGRTLEADRDLKIRLLPGAADRPLTPIADGPIFRSTAMSMRDSAIVPASNWTPANSSHSPNATSTQHQTSCRWDPQQLEDALKLGRPIPVTERPVVLLPNYNVGTIHIND
jgi:hypothetical protein